MVQRLRRAPTGLLISMNNFEQLKSARIASLDIELSEYVHGPTGARHIHLDSADDNNAFMVAFPTLPEDSTGVAHILEHTTLCGSERYPVRDPFFMMLRRSLNTYMNAFTSGDSTAYPFATQNRKDFDNLLSVYLDAVFFPRLHELDFAQEGWRIELETGEQGPALGYHGVVYNEMKGAMSSPLAQLWQHLHASLFPDTIYRHNSGGDPLAIPELTHAALTAFHARHYHPSNAVFLTYGSFSAQEHQQRFEQCALARFDRRDEILLSALQPPFALPHAFEAGYESDADERATHVLWGWVCGESSSPNDVIEAHLLSLLLLEHGASPLRHFLETTDLANAPSELCGVDDSARQLVFVAGVEGSEGEHAETLERQMWEIVRRIAEQGMERDAVDAALDQLEMAQRDIGGDGYPFGLQLMGRILPAAMYRADAVALLDLAPALERMREKIAEPSFIKALVRRRLLENSHRARVVMRPDASKSARDNAVERERLEGILNDSTPEQLTALERRCAALAERQAAADDPSILPRVTLADVPGARPLLKPLAESGEFRYECGSNGVFRAKLAYRMPALNAAELCVLPLFCAYLSELGLGHEAYLAVQERRARLGVFGTYAVARAGCVADEPIHAWLIVSGRGLARKRDGILATVAELLDAVRFDESERLHELLLQSRAEAEQSITDRGHRLAVLSAAAVLTPCAALDEQWEGPSAIRTLQAYAENEPDAARLDELFGLFDAIRGKLVHMPRIAALIGETESLSVAGDWFDPCPASAASAAELFVLPPLRPLHPTAWATSSQVNFCAKAFAAVHEADPDAAALSVLGRYLQDGFLHREIRERGGAYGSGAGYDADSQTFRFFSYRDPRTRETIADFDRALVWGLNDRDPQRLEESILGTIRSLDQPRSPAGEAERSFMSHLSGRDDSTRERYRERVLEVTHDDLHSVIERHLNPARGALGAIGGHRDMEQLSDLGLGLDEL